MRNWPGQHSNHLQRDWSIPTVPCRRLDGILQGKDGKFWHYKSCSFLERKMIWCFFNAIQFLRNASSFYHFTHGHTDTQSGEDKLLRFNIFPSLQTYFPSVRFQFTKLWKMLNTGKSINIHCHQSETSLRTINREDNVKYRRLWPFVSLVQSWRGLHFIFVIPNINITR